MYEINREIGKEWRDHYIYRAKNEAGQCMVFEIYLCVTGELNVCFYITTKRKNGFQEGVSTGKDGIKPLLWARNCLLDFIRFGQYRYKGWTILVHATDKKRFKVYRAALEPLGFRMVLDGKMNLIKKL